MSRSCKKPWIKDNAADFKRICARKYRRTTKQITKVYRNSWFAGDVEGCYPDPHYPHLFQVVDQWDICDWRYYSKEPEAMCK